MSDHPEPERIDEAAAAWVVRSDRGLTAKEQDDFLEWLAGDPRHGAALARYRQDWARLDALSDWRPRHGAQPNPDLLAPRPRPRRVLRWVFATAAAAAALALVMRLAPQQAASTEQNATVAAVTSRVLEDGSVVQLNRGATLEVEFTPAERHVRLTRGEAHFSVAKNPQRPFVVSVKGIDVRAVGTAFNIRAEPAAVEVLVTEGRVELRNDAIHAAANSAPTDGRPSSLEARQRAVVPVGTNPAPIQIDTLTAGEIDRVLSWQHRLMEFSAAPLADIAAEFNRRNSTQLLIMDPELGGVRITATFRTDNVDGFVRLLESGFGVRVKHQGPRDLLLYKAR